MSKGKFSPATVDLIWERDNGSCVVCGRGLHWDARGWGWSVHHRCARGMGGSRVPWISGAANGVLLCGSGTTGCHGDVEAHRIDPVTAGLIISRHGYLTAEDTPVQMHDGLWMLDDSGGKTAYE